jgi:solute carrier family 35 protein F1/2
LFFPLDLISLPQVVGQIGFFGCIINAAQGAGLEHKLFKTVSWSGQNIGFLAAYTCSMLFLYSFAPILFRLSSSPFYNLS